MNLNIALLNQVTAFLNLEADLLDHKEYQNWLQLWHPDGMYIIPVDHDTEDYSNSLNIAYDDAHMRELRVDRLTSGEAVSTQLGGNTVRTISTLRILDSAANESEEVVTVRCAYCLYENNKNGVRTYPGTAQFKLVRDNDSFKILQKVVKLMKSDEHLCTVSYLY